MVYWPDIHDEWGTEGFSKKRVIMAACRTTLSVCYTESKEQEVRSRDLSVVEQEQIRILDQKNRRHRALK
jgi:hypothetical protein